MNRENLATAVALKEAERLETTPTSSISSAIGGQLNPTWVEWLMGFPLEWTVCEPSATPSSRKSRNG
jgi:hypothetical protein